MTSIAIILICLAVGFLIGAVGIGGVLLVPALAFIAGVDVHEAIPACMLAFLPTGVIAVAIYARHGSVQWERVSWLCLGAIPAAFAGAISLAYIPAAAVMLLIAGLMVLAGLDALIKSLRTEAGTKTARLAPLTMVFIGGVTGFGSAITGTGGPLILVPLAIYLGLPALTAIGLSQAIQVPIAAFASTANWTLGVINFELAGFIATGVVVGTVVGAFLIHRVATTHLRKIIAVLLIVVGFGVALRTLAGVG